MTGFISHAAAALKDLLSSSWTRQVGSRYLRSKKNSKFLSFITVLSVGGVGLGVTAMIVVLSVMEGFEGELKKRLMATDLHILITPTRATPGFDRGWVPESTFQAHEIKQVDHRGVVKDVFAVVQAEAILKAGKKVSGVVVKGVSEERLNRLKRQVVETARSQMKVETEGGEVVRLPGIFVGQELAYELDIISGDRVTLISPTEFDGPLQNVPRLKRFVVEGIYRSGTPEQELHTLFAPDTAVRSFLKKAGVISQLEVTVEPFEAAPLVKFDLLSKMPQFKVQDWVDLNSHLFASLKLERTTMFVILAFIVIVASFNIVTTLTLMVLEKRKEIAILKAMGARDSEVGAIFLAEGLAIGLTGIAGGLGLGFVLCLILRRYEFIELPDVFYDRTLPVVFDIHYYLLVGSAALVIVLLACFYPSRRAASLPPLAGIRAG